MSENRSGSVLAADFGNVNTRVVLIDLVDGQYRLVAAGQSRTTMGYPIDDVNVGLHRVLTQISDFTGRNFISEDGDIITPENADRSGADYFLATGSAGRPMRAVIVGLVPDVSIASALKAISTSYVDAAATIHLEDGRDEEARLNAVLLARPDIILIAGGTEGGAEGSLIKLAELILLAVTLINKSQRPTIVYSGNSKLAEKMRAIFNDVTTFLVATNIRPTIDKEELGMVQLQLSRAYNHFEASRGAGFSQLVNSSSTSILPTAQSYAMLVEYFAKTRKTNVIAVDMGSSITTLAGAVNGKVTTTIRTDVGLGHSAASLVEVVGVNNIKRWLPFNLNDADIRNYAMNKMLRPATIPMTLRDMYLEHGLLRAGVRFTLREARKSWNAPPRGILPPTGIIIGAGAAITGTGSPMFNMLLLLDAIQPIGVTEVKIDPLGLIAALGAMAQVNPEGVVQVLDSTDLEHLGTVISISGEPSIDKPALKLKIKTEDGEVFEHEVMGGHLWALPLPEGHTLEVEVRAARGLNVGGKTKIKMRFSGGSAGLIFDARGRVLPLAATARLRAQQLPLWIHEITGDPLQEIEQRLLVMEEELKGEEESTSDQKPTTQRRGLFGRGRSKPDKRDKRTTQAIPTALMEDEEIPEDDEFMRLLDEDEPKETKEDDDLGALRNVLS